MGKDYSCWSYLFDTDGFVGCFDGFDCRCCNGCYGFGFGGDIGFAGDGC